MQKSNFVGKVVVITGASSGFGRGATMRFAKAGASTVIAARRSELLDQLEEICRNNGGNVLSVPTDVSLRADIENLFETTIAEYGKIDVWINNAGVGAIGPFERIPLVDHAQVIDTNLMGTLYGSYYAYSHFLQQDAGILINVASELGRHAVPYYASYTAAKHGVVGLCDALRQEIELNKRENIHVCAVLPTAHDTPFFDHVANYSGHEVQAPEPLHHPQDVVETIFRLAQNPKDKEIVGSDGVVTILMETLMPGVTEKIAARQMHKTQMEDAPPARDTPGAVRSPMRKGTKVSAGRLEKKRA
jgi:short-subunit dehydrogenase